MSSGVSSDTEGEEYNWTNDRSILQSNAALIEEKLKLKEQYFDDLDNERTATVTTEQEAMEQIRVEEEAKQKLRDENILVDIDANKKAAEEKKKLEAEAKMKEEEVAKKKLADEKEKAEIEAKKKEEEEAKKKIDDEKKKAIMETKRKAAEEKKLEAEAKKKDQEEAKKKLADEKKKADMEAKKKANEEKKKLEAEAKKKEDEEKEKAEEERKKKAEAVKKRLEEKQAQAKKLEEEKKQAEEEKKKLEELKKVEMQEKQKAIAEKKLAEIEARKAEEEAKKMAEEEQKLAEAEIKEKAEQVEKFARLQKIEDEKKKAWEEKKLQGQDPQLSVKTPEAAQAVTSNESMKTQGSLKEQTSELNEELLEAGDIKKSKGVKSRSASADKRKKVVDIVKDARISGQEDAGDFVCAEDHQIENKEDLFAAIGDTSLAAGRLAKKRRGIAGASKEDIRHEAGAVPETPVDVIPDETSTNLVLQDEKKSRTSSRERPKDLALDASFAGDSSAVAETKVKSRTVSKERLSKIEPSQEAPEYLKADATLAHDRVQEGKKSRTSSRERPRDLPIASSFANDSSAVAKKTVKSRTVSKERIGKMDPSQELELATENEERTFKQSVTDFKPVRSRTSSDTRQPKVERPRSRQRADVEQEELEEEIIQQYAGRSKFAASRTSSSEDDNIVTGLPYAGRQQKSRTTSKERPNSRQQNLLGIQNVVDTDVAERPHSAASVGSSKKAKSRTVSRERANVPKGAQTSKVDVQKRSRTSSKDSQAQEVEQEELFEPQEVAHQAMEKDQHPRRFRDEAALDFEEQELSRAGGKSFYDNGIRDSEAIEDFDDQYDMEEDDEIEEDEEPPPTEPIFEYSNEQDTIIVPTYEIRSDQNERYDDTDFEISRQIESNGYIADAEQYASEMDHSEDELGNRVTKAKKVSFAAENEQFNMKPEPDVKVIPGTNMFCFAPSSTHEQPADLVDGVKVTKTQSVSKTAPEGQDILSEQQTQDQEGSHKKESVPVQSSSPKAFLKQMVGIGGGKTMSRDSSKASGGGETRERSNSLLGTILRRGSRSTSQGSQGSSRQESMERGGSETGAPYMVTDSYKTVDSSVGESEENVANVATASDPGAATFFKRIGKKKKPQVKATDFEELFARGHALSAQLDEQQPNATAMHGVSLNGFSFSPETVKNASQQSGVLGTQPASGPLNSQPPTPFAMFSQEEAFKQSQQGAGLSYEEKVQSYLDDQQHTAPFIQQPMDLEYVDSNTEQYKSGSEKEHRSRSRKKPSAQSQPTAQVPTKPAANYAKPEDVRIDSVDSEDVMAFASLPTVGSGVTSGTNMAVPSSTQMRMITRDPSGENVTKRGRSESTASNKRRQMTPEVFLKSLEDIIIKKVEADQQHTQPMWQPAVQSPNDLPPTKQSHPQTEANDSLLRTHAQRLDSPRPASPLNKSPTRQLRPVSPYGVAAELRPSDRSPSPFGPSKQSSLLQQQPQANIPAIYQQSPSPRPESGPGMQRIAPSPGKSYLDQPSSLSPDPFQSRIEEQTSIDGTAQLPPLPSPSAAKKNSSSILADLTMRIQSEIGNQHDIDAMKYGARDTDRQNQNVPVPRKEMLAGDAHIPMQLQPDPLTAHVLQSYEQPQQLRIAYPDQDDDSKKETYSQSSIRDTNLYRKLQEGLSSVDKLVQSEIFQDEMTRAGVDYRKYSHHLGRAEFGTLKKRSSLGDLSSIDGKPPSGFDRPETTGVTQTPSDINDPSGFAVQQSASATQLMGRTRFGGGAVGTTDSSRETSRERPVAATAAQRAGKRPSRQSSQESSIGRPDSRLSDNIPDLETEQHPFPGLGVVRGRRAGSSSSRGIGGDSGRRPQMMELEDEERRLQERLDIKPHPEVFEKRQEVLQEMAAQKQTVKEAKGKQFISQTLFIRVF